MAGDGGRHPLTSGCPPEWASAWGQDQFGVFVEFRVGEVDQRMRWIRPGSFLMGSPETERGRDDDEGPQHEVILSRGFWLADTPVTQALWTEVMGENPSGFKDGGDLRRPVEQVSWEDCQRFCAQLREQLRERSPGSAFRLSTEAEWEYACRARTRGATYGEALGVQLDDIAWYSGNSNGQTHLVKEKLANQWGLHDMLGNVYEWCSDYAYRRYSSTTACDPKDTTSGEARVLRGGSWGFPARYVRAACRGASDPGDRHSSLGLRLARDQDQ